MTDFENDTKNIPSAGELALSPIIDFFNREARELSVDIGNYRDFETKNPGIKGTPEGASKFGSLYGRHQVLTGLHAAIERVQAELNGDNIQDATMTPANTDK